MNDENSNNAWSGIKEIIQKKWSKLSAVEVDSLKNNLDGLVTKIMVTYGFARGRAEREYHEFRVSLRPILAPAVKAPEIRHPRRY